MRVKDNNTAYQAAWRRRLRERVIVFLGGKCCRCGFSDWRALQVDHVHGGGSSRKDRAYDSTPALYAKVLSDTENNYQLLCANCNWIKRYENSEVIINSGNHTSLGLGSGNNGTRKAAFNARQQELLNILKNG